MASSSQAQHDVAVKKSPGLMPSLNGSRASPSSRLIIDALEGPMALTECVHHPNQCGIESHCGVGRAWQQVNRAIYRSLQQLSLVELAGLGAEPVRFSALERRLGSLTGSRRES